MELYMRKTLALSLALSVALNSQAMADPISDFLTGAFGGKAHAAQSARLSRHGVGRKMSTVHARPHGSGKMKASFYGGGPRRYEPNALTANGERFNQWAMTAAHRTLPFGTLLNVCYVRCAVVRINDRGPAAWTGNALDLSRGAATAIGLIGAGTGFVQVAQVN
jgi:rare lipoprotein A